MTKSKKKFNNKIDNNIDWLRNPILSHCFFLGNKKITGRFNDIREILINEEFKDTLYRFLPRGYGYKLSLEKSYSLLLRAPNIIKQYKKLLKKRTNNKKKGESLDIFIESLHPSKDHLFIEVKRYMDGNSRSVIETDIEKVKDLINLYNSSDNNKNNFRSKGFVLVISQRILPNFIIDHTKLSAIKNPIQSKKNKETFYKNRITCIVLSRNLNKVNQSVKENKKIKGIFACLLEVIS